MIPPVRDARCHLLREKSLFEEINYLYWLNNESRFEDADSHSDEPLRGQIFAHRATKAYNRVRTADNHTERQRISDEMSPPR